MMSFKGYANDTENERVNIESMCSFLENVYVYNLYILNTAVCENFEPLIYMISIYIYTYMECIVGKFPF